MKIFESFSDFLNERRLEYSAVILDEPSRSRLLNEFRNVIPEDWKVIADHMTIAFRQGLNSINRLDDKDQMVTIYATHLGISDKAIAVRVEGYPSTNKIAHITLAINVKAGGKPVMSNDIENWDKIKKIVLRGKVVEVMS